MTPAVARPTTDTSCYFNERMIAKVATSCAAATAAAFATLRSRNPIPKWSHSISLKLDTLWTSMASVIRAAYLYFKSKFSLREAPPQRKETKPTERNTSDNSLRRGENLQPLSVTPPVIVETEPKDLIEEQIINLIERVYQEGAFKEAFEAAEKGLQSQNMKICRSAKKIVAAH